jgi:hypothetical protein
MTKSKLLYSLLVLSTLSVEPAFTSQENATYQMVEDKANLQILTPALEKER